MMDLIAFSLLLVVIFFLAAFAMQRNDLRLSAHERPAPAPSSCEGGAAPATPTGTATEEWRTVALLMSRPIALLIVLWVVTSEFVALASKSDPNPWTAGMAELGSASLRWYSSIVILCLVVAVVVIGIYMSMHQFESSIQEQRLLLGKNPAPLTNLSISAKGITIVTPATGIVILVISIVFLGLFVKFVTASDSAPTKPQISPPTPSPVTTFQPHHAAMARPSTPR